MWSLQISTAGNIAFHSLMYQLITKESSTVQRSSGAYGPYSVIYARCNRYVIIYCGIKTTHEHDINPATPPCNYSLQLIRNKINRLNVQL